MPPGGLRISRHLYAPQDLAADARARPRGGALPCRSHSRRRGSAEPGADGPPLARRDARPAAARRAPPLARLVPRLSAGRPVHLVGPHRRLPRGPGRRLAADEDVGVRPYLRGAPAEAPRRLLAGEPGAPGGHPQGRPAPRRSRGVERRREGAHPPPHAAGRLAGLRRPRQRVVLGRGGDGRGLRARRRAGGDGRDAPGRGRADRPAPEPGRPRALRQRLPPAAGGRRQPAARRGRALGALARRPAEPLPDRPQPRLGVGEPAGDPPADRRLPLVGAAGLRRLPRDGDREFVLLPPLGRADQSADRPPRHLLARRLRPRQRRGLRPPGVDLLQGRELRPLLPRLRRLLPEPARRRGDDLRDGRRRPGRRGADASRTAPCSPSPTASPGT